MDGVFICLALVLSYVESLIPYSFAVPGIKIGLPNLVIVFVLFRVGNVDAFLISLIRVFLVALLFGNYYSFCYAICGALFSFSVMILLKATKKFHLETISIAGAVFHHIGQILAAVLILGASQILFYLPVLILAGIATGLFIGFLASLLVKRVPHQLI